MEYIFDPSWGEATFGIMAVICLIALALMHHDNKRDQP